MKLVRVAATDQDSRKGKEHKTRNSYHMFYIDSHNNDENIERIEKLLEKNHSHDGNIQPHNGNSSIFYIPLDKIAQFKEDYKNFKKKS